MCENCGAQSPVEPGTPNPLKLSVIIPCFNEAKNIVAVIEAVEKLEYPKEIIVVDDGSTDNFRDVLAKYDSDSLVVHHSILNFGKGTAIRIGLGYVTGDIVIVQDADLEYSPSEIPKVIEPILAGRADVVYGSRFLGSIEGMKLPNLIANKILAWTANLLYSAGITDEATCYKAFRTEIIKGLKLQCRRFEFCPEVTAKVRKKHIKIMEVPIDYHGRDTAEGKKIRWTDAFSAMWTLIKYRFVG